MDSYKLLITGGVPLVGETYVSGGKNTSVAVVPAALLSDEPCTIEHLPDIEDVRVLVDIMRSLGATVDYQAAARRMTVDPRTVTSCKVPYRQSQRMRASYYLLGALLGVRFLAAGASGHVQSLILAAVLMLLGAQTFFMGLQADLIASNRKMLEEIQYRLRRRDADEAQQDAPQDARSDA